MKTVIQKHPAEQPIRVAGAVVKFGEKLELPADQAAALVAEGRFAYFEGTPPAAASKTTKAKDQEQNRK